MSDPYRAGASLVLRRRCTSAFRQANLMSWLRMGRCRCRCASGEEKFGTFATLIWRSRRFRGKIRQPAGRVFDMARIKLRYVNEYRDRHGRVRRYVRVPGSRGVPLPGLVGSGEFMAAYQAAIAKVAPPPLSSK